ncbi:hypothetical protein B9Z55_020058 [Caenorhabditis nigoni]|uniref:7TM GPCR serpentine receptor class x (Srx) domain-containing protein n=2 Tax=Caenorhabditis nigoni TaxID=1611254 RepID=A0A2G5TL25_9PELO|nr:hypothetical protein B9Z55_020058 [Caenorhabditis nigoni]
MECLVQIVMAVNRFAVITLNKHYIFTFNTTMIIFFFLVSTTVFSVVCTQYFFPCCKFILDQDALTMLFINIEGLYSYSNLMLVSYDIVCTTTSTICYAAVFFSIRNSQKSVASNINRSSQDSKFLLQFVLISIFYVLAWVLFETLPFIVPADQPQWYAVIPFLVTLNCSSNVIIYLALNREIQKSVRTSWLASKISAATVSSQVQSRPATTN